MLQEVTKPPASYVLHQIAGRALSDYRSVRRFFEGRPVRPLVRIRIVAACDLLGIDLPDHLTREAPQR